MAQTIDAKSGQILGTDGQPMSASNPASIFVGNMSNLLSYITKTNQAGTAGLNLNTQGLKAQEANLATPGATGNPINGLYAFLPGSAQTTVSGDLGDIMNPTIQSQESQVNTMNATAGSLANTVSSSMQGEIAAYTATKPNWELSPTPDPETGKFYFYNTNVPPGTAPQIYKPGEVPSGVGGSSGGSPSSASSPGTLAAANNSYGIKMSATTTKLFEDLGVTPGPKATDGGNFWVFPDETSAEKGARLLLQSPTYANDSVDQALRQWSNYTGTGQYPGYNAEILKGTGIDPNSVIKNLTPAQIDVVLQKMREAENVGGSTSAPKTQTKKTDFSDAPITVQVAGRTTTTGDRYLVANKLDANTLPAARVYAQKNNVPILDDSEVTAVQGTDSAIKNLNTLFQYFSQIAPDYGVVGKAYADLSIPLNKFLDTNYGAAVKAYQSNRDALFQQINALAGSHPRINVQELNIAANALPTMSWPNPDTFKDGEAKLSRTYQILNNALSTFIPGAKGATPPSSVSNQYIPGATGGATQGVTPSGIRYTIQ